MIFTKNSIILTINQLKDYKNWSKKYNMYYLEQKAMEIFIVHYPKEMTQP